MVLAPVVVALVLWVVTQSTFALIFAALGPITALGSVVDARLTARRTRRREALRLTSELRELERSIDEWHRAERRARQEELPSALAVVREGRGAGTEHVRLGLGRVPTDLTISGADRSSSPVVAVLAERAANLESAPVHGAVADGVGIVGPATVRRAVQRSLLCQLTPSSTARVVTAARARDLPPGVGVELRIAAGQVTVTRHPSRAARGVLLQSELVSEEEVLSWRTRSGDAIPNPLPSHLDLCSLLDRPDPDSVAGRTPPGLSCQPAVDTEGPIQIDLVADGPHAIVGGTTGSGKSEVLIAWLLAMAAAHPPEEVTLLLIDFKGGATFAPLETLPHTVGIITDLDHGGAARALESLAAEVRYRERTLAERGVRQIEGSGMPRLVIVVDEFAAMLDQHPELPALFADLAARGRSLGVHLILATQRPAGVVRESVLANADLRISLRVNNAADSTAVVGTPDAAQIGATQRGRAVIRAAGQNPRTVQFALASRDDIAAVATAHAGATRPRRPWCAPLPTSLSVSDLPATDGIGFGLLDEPHLQRQVIATWSAETALFVLGAARSGVTTTLVTLAWAADRAGLQCRWIPTAPDAAWDALHDLLRELDTPADSGRRTVVLLDDLDALLARFSGDFRVAVADGFSRVLREGPARGIVVVASAQRLAGESAAIATSISHRLLLRQANRQEHVMAGGEGAHFDSGLPPGGGWWRGCRVQVAETGLGRPVDPVARVAQLTPDRPLAIVSTRSVAVARSVPGRVRMLSSVTGDPDLAPGEVLVGDPDEWQSRFGLVAAIRDRADLILDDCSLADVRLLTRSRQLPPPLAPGRGLAWRLRPDGALERVRLPGAGDR